MSDGVSSVSPSLDATTNPAAPANSPSVNGNSSPATTTSNIQANLVSAKDTVVSSAQSTLNSVQNSQAVQDIKNGPVAQNVSKEATKTTSEFKDLYGSKEIPSDPAATGQPLTQYHSIFYRLLSWQNPRATGITFASTILLIFAARYLNLLSYAFKFSYFILGVTASLEIAGKLLFDDGLASKMRPRKYWTISRETLERNLDDIEQLLNFFIIESQRILYAENVYATIGVFFSALVSYWLIKLVPFWGLSLIFTFVMYLGPLVYINNREAIDSGFEHVGDVVSTQASQIKNITAEHTSKATESIKSYAGEYSSKAQSYAGEYSSKAQELVGSKQPAGTTSTTASSDFPVAPKQEPMNSFEPTAAEKEPLLS